MTSPAYTNYGIAEPTPISSPLLKPSAVGVPPPTLSSPAVRPTAPDHAGSGGGSGNAPGGPAGGGAGFGPGSTGATGVGGVFGSNRQAPPPSLEPEAIKDELEAFCSDAAALDAFYKDTLERGAQTVSTSPQTATAGLPPEQNDNDEPDVNIPTLGLPPGVLGGVGGGTGGGSTVNPAPPRSGGGGGGPALMGSLLRRGSVQYDGLLPGQSTR
jgi:DEP domain-containing protein 5